MMFGTTLSHSKAELESATTAKYIIQLHVERQHMLGFSTLFGYTGTVILVTGIRYIKYSTVGYRK